MIIKKINDLNLNKLTFILINLFVFFLPYDRFYTTMILYVWIAVVILNFKVEKIKHIPRQFWVFQGVIYLSIIGSLYSFYKEDAISLVGRQMALLVFPILIPLSIRLDKENILKILKTLKYTSVISILLIGCMIFYKINLLQVDLRTIQKTIFFNQEFSGNIGIHATYLSILIAVSLLITLYEYLNGKGEKYDKFMIAIMSLGLLFLSTRIVLILVIFQLFLIFPFIINQKKKYLIYLSILTIIGFGFVYNFSYIAQRFNNDLKTDLSIISQEQNDINVEPRADRWKLCLELIKEEPLLGHGTGDEIPLLKEKYKEHFYFKSYVESLNAHNEYLSILIKHGIIGFLFFIFLFGYFLKIALKNRDVNYLLFLSVILMVFLTENVLDTNKGIFIFSFFNTLFGYRILQESRQKKDTSPLAIIDPVGNKAGMDYYDNELQTGLISKKINCYVFSNFSSNQKQFNYFPNFVKNKFIQLLRYFVAINKSLYTARNKKVGIVILHSFSYEYKDLLLYLLCKLYGVKIFTIAHDISSFSNKDKRWIFSLIYQRISSFIMVHNEFSKNKLEQLLKVNVDSKIAIIPHGHFLNLPGINISREEARMKLNIPLDEKMILFFGQIKKQKGLDILIEALSQTKGTTYHLTIAGKIWKETFEKYDDLITKNLLNKRIRKIIRYITNEERDLLFKACDVVIIPYREIYQSGVLLMAMSYRKLVIASNLQSNLDLITDGKNGLIFEANNSKNLAEKIDSFFQLNDVDKNQLLTNVYEKIKIDHEWDNISTQIIEHIDSLSITKSKSKA